ncbi:hypothetical protein PaVLD_ORF063L [Planktothrix phage PaV-LD]|uniref:hypothetical protein n=1 Tax=Planktothrix phage PaV-LD TaxID=994601 RepID=UPI000243C8C4|nr:hypothetical protein PaVLD_ORF063L [Planktothrix phage PaV-LD]ADZ31570.1 hypothetical protein PaVLD_ORF063L [Planktothrix phage PaV-LD]
MVRLAIKALNFLASCFNYSIFIFSSYQELIKAEKIKKENYQFSEPLATNRAARSFCSFVSSFLVSDLGSGVDFGFCFFV